MDDVIWAIGYVDTSFSLVKDEKLTSSKHIAEGHLTLDFAKHLFALQALHLTL